jgi:aryl-alcohol dehydrogenase-like predicted oxidoreductase
VTNATDAIGDLWPSGLAGSPDNGRIRATARSRGVSVMGIRALAAGALADGLDRVAPAGSPVARDGERAAPFLALAREHGVSPAHLAHRYAVSLPDVATLVIGAKTRHELTECLAAEEAPPMSRSELSEIEAQARRGLVRT